MAVSLDPVALIARSGENHNKYGDPYDTVATITRGESHWYIQATIGKMRVSEAKQLTNLLKAIHDIPIKWIRIKKIP